MMMSFLPIFWLWAFLMMATWQSSPQKCHDERHTDVNAVLNLLKVTGTRVVVDLDRDLVYAGKGVEDPHILLRELHLFRSQNVAVLQADIVFLVEEAFLLDAGHIEDVKLRKGIVQAVDFLERNIVAAEHILTDIAGDLEFLGGDEDKADVRITDHGFDQGVDRAPEFQVSAEADGEIVKPALQGTDGQEICEGLGRMLMAPVAGIDDRDRGHAGSDQRRAFLRMTHCHDIRVAGDHAGGIRDGFTLGCGAGVRGLEPHDASAETEHGGFKGKAGPGTGLVKAGRKLFSVAHVCVGLRPFLDVIGEIQERVDLFHGEIERIQQVS